MSTLRVVTFNILHGWSVGAGVDPLLLRAAIRRLNPDVLALQEVDVDQERSGRTDLTAVAAEAMDAVAHRFVAAIAGTPGSTWTAATGAEQPGSAAYGIALLSRHPASNWQVLRLPPVPRRVLVASDEPRAAVIASFDTPLGPLTIANTHLTFVPGWNRRQLHRVVAAVSERPGPRLIVGDLNLRASAARRESGMRTLAVAPTYPAHRPRRQLDHVLTDDSGLTVRHWETPAMPISDHRPVVVDLQRR